nr:hypothetical protein BaRGS_021763 [Batillaria attramentaria]
MMEVDTLAGDDVPPPLSPQASSAPPEKVVEEDDSLGYTITMNECDDDSNESSAASHSRTATPSAEQDSADSRDAQPPRLKKFPENGDGASKQDAGDFDFSKEKTKSGKQTAADKDAERTPDINGVSQSSEDGEVVEEIDRKKTKKGERPEVDPSDVEAASASEAAVEEPHEKDTTEKERTDKLLESESKIEESSKSEETVAGKSDPKHNDEKKNDSNRQKHESGKERDSDEEKNKADGKKDVSDSEKGDNNERKIDTDREKHAEGKKDGDKKNNDNDQKEDHERGKGMIDMIKWEAENHINVKPKYVKPNPKAELGNLAKWIFDLGSDLVKEFVYHDLVKIQRKRKDDGNLNDKEKSDFNKLQEIDEDLNKKIGHLKFRLNKSSQGLQKHIEVHKADLAGANAVGNGVAGKCISCGHRVPNILMHMRMVHNRELRHYLAALMCIFCGNRFSSKREVENHMGSQHAAGMRTCQICGEKGFHPAYYIKHMRDRHLRRCSVVLRRIDRAVVETFKRPITISDSEDDDVVEAPLSPKRQKLQEVQKNSTVSKPDKPKDEKAEQEIEKSVAQKEHQLEDQKGGKLDKDKEHSSDEKELQPADEDKSNSADTKEANSDDEKVQNSTSKTLKPDSLKKAFLCIIMHSKAA